MSDVGTRDYRVVGILDDLGFPTGYHALAEGDEMTACGRVLDEGSVYIVYERDVGCEACKRSLTETVEIPLDGPA